MRLIQQALTFDDVLLVPNYSNILPRDASLKTKISRNITLNIPIVSAAMDTVTESRLAIALAQEGGMGIIHKNLTPAKQALEVARVKRYESGVLRDPITVTPDMTILQVLELAQEAGVSGFPVVSNRKVVGIITNRDLRFEESLSAKVSEKMTPRDKLITINEADSLDEAKRLLNKHRLERVLIIDDNDELRGLITVKDIQKPQNTPTPCAMPTAICALAPQWAWALKTTSALTCSPKQAWTSSSLTPPTATRKACLTASNGLKPTTHTST
jgi:IMP dehydrogenase